MNKKLDENLPENIKNVFDIAKAGLDKDSALAGSGADSSANINNNENKETTKMINDQEIAKAVAEQVEAIFAQKDAQKQVESKITALESEKASLSTKVQELTSANEALVNEKAAIEASKAEIETKRAELEEANKALATEKEKIQSEANAAKAEIEKINKEKTLAERKAKLESEKILIEDEALAGKQIAKISEMTDEQFAEYVEELKSIAAKCGEPKDAEKKKSEKTDKAKASIEEVQTQDVSVGQIYVQAIASAQSPSEPDAGRVSLYAQM